MGKKFKARFIFIALIAVVIVIVLARTTSDIKNVLFKKKPPPGAKAPAQAATEEEAIPVKVMKVKRMDFKDTLPCIGNIKGFREIDLKFQTSGVLESFNFEEGETVQEGDIIASLMQRDALLKLKYAEIEANKTKKLFDLGAVNSMKYEQAKLEYESAKSDLDKTNIYAMSDGLLGSKLMDSGSYVSPNDKIGIFIDIAKVYAEFSIIEKDVPKVALGQKAEVFVDAYPNKAFSGTVDMISPIIEGRSRTETVKIELDNKEDLLRPGMFVRALVATYEKRDDIVIPASSLKKKENEYFIFVVHKDEPKEKLPEAKAEVKKEGGGLAKQLALLGVKKGKDKGAEAGKEEPKAAEEKAPETGTVEVRKIKLGYMTQDMVEVEDGVQEDELIIKEAQEEFKDKAKVEIVEVEEGTI